MKQVLIRMVRPVAMTFVSLQIALTIAILSLEGLVEQEMCRNALLIISILSAVFFANYLIVNRIMMIQYRKEERRQIERFLRMERGEKVEDED